MSSIACPNCGFYYDAEINQDYRKDVIWPCNISFDAESEVTTHQFECSACGKYFFVQVHPDWQQPKYTIGGRAAVNDKRS